LQGEFVKFLIKIEDTINQFIEKYFNKLKEITPGFIFSLIAWIKHFPEHLKTKIKSYLPKIRLLGLKTVGYIDHYITMVRGYIISVIMYLRSDEFKQKDKFSLLVIPIKYIKQHPAKSISLFIITCSLISAMNVIFKNTETIVIGTKSLRKPASMENVKEEFALELKNHKFEVKIASAGGGHGASTEAHEHELFLDVKIDAKNEKDKQSLEEMEEMLDDNLEALELSVAQLPLNSENLKQLEEIMIKSLNADFNEIGYQNLIKSIELKQVLPKRPGYYRQSERMISIEDISLQIFLEDTHRNRQVWIDFSILASNRNAIMYLNEHMVELKDHLTNNVEPIIPQLPVEEEGRLIIKDKIKYEVNAFLEKNKIEGKILEVYIDYLMAS